MLILLALMIILWQYVPATLEGAGEGLRFYLSDFSKVKEAGIMDVVFAAMGQAFTPSLVLERPPYLEVIDKRNRQERLVVTVLDTCVAFWLQA